MMQCSRGVFINLLDGNRDEWRRQVEGFADLAVDHVELLCEHLVSGSDAEFIRELLGPVRTTIHAPYIGVSLAAADEDLRRAGVARVSKFAAAAKALAADVVTVHSGPVGAWEGPEALDRLVKSLNELWPVFEGRLALENMPARGGGTREPFARLTDAINVLDRFPGLPFTLDVGHVIQNGESLADWLDIVGPTLRNVHLHDGRSGGAGHVAIGSGELHLNEFLAMLASRDYRGSIALETITVEDTKLSWKSWEASLRTLVRDAP